MRISRKDERKVTVFLWCFLFALVGLMGMKIYDNLTFKKVEQTYKLPIPKSKPIDWVNEDNPKKIEWMESIYQTKN